MDAILLSELQAEIKSRLEDLTVWVKAEIASHTESRGHHYFDLIEKNSGGIAAKARAVVWANQGAIIPEFEKVTGRRLEAGLSVVMLVSVNYHPQFGLSLIIRRFDPTFTLGERELERQKTIQALTQSGLMQKQKELPLPFLPGRVAVITSRDAAGYGDFVKHLGENQWGFRFDTVLVPSLMQGDGAPVQVCAALDSVAADGRFDLALILRGGGADADMFCFDDRRLCESIARCPVPVLTAVGHEKDHHVCDLVACRSYKTPTALADALVEWTANVESDMTNRFDAVTDAAADRVNSAETELSRIIAEIRFHLSDRMMKMKTAVLSTCSSTAACALKRIDTMEKMAASRISGIRFAASAVVDAAEMKVKLADSEIRAADPRNILRLGYVLLSDSSGKVMKSVFSGAVGQEFCARFNDGFWGCTIDTVSKPKTIEQ